MIGKMVSFDFESSAKFYFMMTEENFMMTKENYFWKLQKGLFLNILLGYVY